MESSDENMYEVTVSGFPSECDAYFKTIEELVPLLPDYMNGKKVPKLKVIYLSLI